LVGSVVGESPDFSFDATRSTRRGRSLFDRQGCPALAVAPALPGRLGANTPAGYRGREYGESGFGEKISAQITTCVERACLTATEQSRACRGIRS